MAQVAAAAVAARAVVVAVVDRAAVAAAGRPTDIRAFLVGPALQALLAASAASAVRGGTVALAVVPSKSWLKAELQSVTSHNFWQPVPQAV